MTTIRSAIVWVSVAVLATRFPARSVGYEKANGGLSTNLGPKDGYYSLGLGGTYTIDNVKISGGLRYVMIGDAETPFGPFPGGDFTDNSAIGLGLKVSYAF